MLNTKTITLKQGLPILIGVGSGLVIYLSIKHYLELRKYRHIPGPKSKGLLSIFLGNYSEIVEATNNGMTFSDLLLNWFRNHGSIYKVHFFGSVLVSVNDPDAVKKALIDFDLAKNGIIYKQMAYPYGLRCLGNGLVTEIDKEKWKNRRALFNHGFQRNVLMSCIKEFNDKSNVLMEKLRSSADGKTMITLFNEINRFTLDVIATVAFGINNDSVNESNNPLNALINKLLQGMNDLLVDPLVQLRPSKSKMIKEFKNALKELRRYSKEHIKQRIKDIENNEYIPNDILTIIINNNFDNKIDLEDLIDEFLTFFIAGQETTANSLAFCIQELGQTPEVLEKLKAEVDRVLGAKSQISYDDLAELEYTSCVFKEVLRKWPPAPEFSRKTTEQIELDGYVIPKNSWVAVSPYVSGRNPKYFPEPEKFIPERFLKDSEIAKQNTFSIGPRNCIGQNFAQIEGKIFLAKFIQNFDFKLDPTQSFKGKELLTLRPADGCRLYLTPRNDISI